MANHSLLTMLTLIQHPLTINSEVARWLIDHKQLHFVAKNVSLQSYLLEPLRSNNKIFQPVLKDNEAEIMGITGILHYLDAQYPDERLIPVIPSQRQKVVALTRQSNQLARLVEHWIYEELSRAGLLSEVLLEEKSAGRTTVSLMDQVYRLGIKTGQFFGQKALPDINREIEIKVAQIAKDFDLQPNQYVLGDLFSAADIFLVSTLAPLLGMLDSPWEGIYSSDISQSMQEFKEKMLAHPLALYALRVYGQERQARVDWHGVWEK